MAIGGFDDVDVVLLRVFAVLLFCAAGVLFVLLLLSNDVGGAGVSAFDACSGSVEAAADGGRIDASDATTAAENVTFFFDADVDVDDAENFHDKGVVAAADAAADDSVTPPRTRSLLGGCCLIVD